MNAVEAENATEHDYETVYEVSGMPNEEPKTFVTKAFAEDYAGKYLATHNLVTYLTITRKVQNVQ